MGFAPGTPIGLASVAMTRPYRYKPSGGSIAKMSPALGRRRVRLSTARFILQNPFALRAYGARRKHSRQRAPAMDFPRLGIASIRGMSVIGPDFASKGFASRGFASRGFASGGLASGGFAPGGFASRGDVMVQDVADFGAFVKELAYCVGRQNEAIAKGNAAAGNAFARRYVAAFEKLR